MKNLVIKGVECRLNENGVVELNLEHIARGLGFTQIKNKVEYVRWETVSEYLYELGFSQQVGKDTLVPENIFYKLCFKAKNETAKSFQDLVTDDILPSIRKHGAYMTPETIEKTLLSPDFIIKLATNLKEEQEKRFLLEKENAVLKPKAALMDKVLDTGEKIDIGQTAKILGLPYGRNTLFKRLRDLGVFFKNRNEPKQEYVDRKYFELKEQWIERNSHDSFMIVKVLVTQKGLEFINKILEGNKSDGKQLKIA